MSTSDHTPAAPAADQSGMPMYCTKCELWSTSLPRCYWCEGKLVPSLLTPKAVSKDKAA